MDEETRAWLEAERQAAQARRMAHYAEEERQAAARRQAASTPFWEQRRPWLTYTFRKVYDAGAASAAEVSEIQTIQGIIYDVYGVISGHLDGGDDFTAFAVTTGEHQSAWRELPDGNGHYRAGCAVIIKFAGDADALARHDHLDTQPLEIWVGV